MGMIMNEEGVLLTESFLTEVAFGDIPNYDIGVKFGRNADLDTGTIPEDVWHGGGIYTGQPENYTPETVTVVSDSTDDAAAGTGARTVRIIGLKTDTSEEYESEDFTLNGTTPVTSSNSWWRINRAYVLTAGSGGKNAGIISVIPSTTTANVMVRLPATFNQSHIAALTVPHGKILLIKRLRAAITRASGAAGSATLSLRVREPGGVYRSLRVYEMQTGATVSEKELGGIMMIAGTDIKFTVDDVSDNNTVVDASFEWIEVREES